MKKIRLFSLFFLLPLLIGCQKQQDAGEAIAFTFTDSLGRTVSFSEPIEKIAPSGLLSQLPLFAIAPDMLAFWSSALPEESAGYIDEKYGKLPVLGHLYGGKTGFDPEALLLADPDVVIDIGQPKSGMAEELDALSEQTGIPFVHIDGSLSTMDKTFLMLGELLGLEAEGERLADYCEETYARALSVLEKAGGKRSAVYLTGEDGLGVVTKGSYQAELIDLVAENAADTGHSIGKGTGSMTDLEQLYRWDPEVIFLAPGKLGEEIERDPLWQQLTAVQNGEVYEAPGAPYCWAGFPPSVQRYPGLLWMEKMLYPEAADFDLYAETARYFELFYHHELTEEAFAGLIS